MYRFLGGFCLGVYVGTKYNFTNYVDRIDKEWKTLYKKIKKPTSL